MHKTLHEFVRRAWVKQIEVEQCKVDKTLKDQYSLYQRAGYTTKACQVETKLTTQTLKKTHAENLQKFQKQFSRKILLKTPDFRNIQITIPSLTRRILECGTIIVGISLILLLLGYYLEITRIIVITVETSVNPIYVFAFFWFMASGIGILGMGMYDDLRNVKEFRFKGILLDNRYLVETPIHDYSANVPQQIVQETINLKNQGLTPRIWFVAKVEEIPNVTNVNMIVRRLDPLLVGYMKGVSAYVVLGAVWGEDIEDLNKYFEEKMKKGN